MLNGQSPAGVSAAAVVGAGLMGRRIAGVLARAGIAVSLHDANAEVLEQGVAVARTMATEGMAGTSAGEVTGHATLAGALEGVDYVTEAILEDLELKKQVVAEISQLNPTTIIATNTSVLPVSRIAELASAPERVVGTHWWNPPDLIPIVEVVRGEQTSTPTMDRTVALLEHLGKLPVRVERDVPGFVGNRLQHALWREAIALVADGVCDAETVDLVCRNTIGLRLAQLGPIENADYVGLDLTRAIHDAVLPSLNIDAQAHDLLTTMIDAGNLGAKSGQGFLTWPPGRREEVAESLAAHITAQLND